MIVEVTSSRRFADICVNGESNVSKTRAIRSPQYGRAVSEVGRSVELPPVEVEGQFRSRRGHVTWLGNTANAKCTQAHLTPLTPCSVTLPAVGLSERMD